MSSSERRRSESPTSTTRYSQEEERQDGEDSNLIPEPPLNPNRPMHAETRAAFNQPAPSRLSRAALIVGILVMLWIASKLGQWGEPVKPQVIYANRYELFVSPLPLHPVDPPSISASLTRYDPLLPPPDPPSLLGL